VEPDIASKTGEGAPESPSRRVKGVMVEKQPPLIKPYQCALCENRYTRQEHLDRHV
jgi:hypothetical protein